MESKTELKAYELCSPDFGDVRFKQKGGRVIWEAITTRDGSSYCISRVVQDGGKPFMLGLGYIKKWIKPDAILELVDGPMAQMADADK